MSSGKDPLARIRHLLTGLPVDLREIAHGLGINVWESRSLPEDVAGKLTTDPKRAGASGFSIIVRISDPLVRKRFTIAHEIGHFLLHSHLLEDGEIVDRIDSQSKELYRSNLRTPMEIRANSVAADILMPWNLLAPLINERASKLETLFQVSREVIDIRLASPTAIRLKRGVRVSPALESEFRILVDKWHADTEHSSSVKKIVSHPAYRRIITIGLRALPLLFRELNKRPDHWLVALNAITHEDPAPDGCNFSEAVEAWLGWGRDRGYLK